MKVINTSFFSLYLVIFASNYCHILKALIFLDKMSAFLACIASWLRSSKPTFKHAFNLKFPPVMHLVLDDQYLQKFEEVFVIGDIHGCYDELETLLEKANARKDSILKIFVGDLVNKGPKNHEVVFLLRNSASMLSVRGNHDEIVLQEYYKSQKSGYVCKDEENKWIKDFPKEDIEYLDNLPFTISIPQLKAIFVHAGLMPGIPLDANDPQKMVTMRNLVEGSEGLLASKEIKEGKPWASLWPGPDHVYFGHDARRQLQLYPYATGLDTGCLYGRCLTGYFISGPRKGLFVDVQAVETYQIPGKSYKKSTIK